MARRTEGREHRQPAGARGNGGNAAAPETHIDATLMLDAGSMMGMPKHTLLVGLEYEYWKNKFGNPTVASGAGPGATAHTPMVRAEYHF